MASISTCLTVSAKSHFLSSKPSVSLKSFPRIQTLTSYPSFPRKSVNILRPRVSFPVIKASIDVRSNAIRPVVVVETDKLPSDVRKRAIEAVDACGRRVTIGDVSSKAGLNLNQAQKALQALASDTNGFLEVSDEGDVLYAFPKDYRAKLAAKSFRIKFEPWVDKAKQDNDSPETVKSGSSSPDFLLFLPLCPMVVFSFVFGDGDPNQGIEEERWKLIGQYIASHGGIVMAEELAPYLDLQTTNGALSDESYILPVLLRFDGQPEIDKEGNILYRFPSLQRTASSQRSVRKEYVVRRWSDWVGGVEEFVKEKKWQFSKTSPSDRGIIVVLGGINLFGVIILGAMLKDAAIAPCSFIKFYMDILPLLQIYAVSFFAIPLVRCLIIIKRNSDIEKRNQIREQFARAFVLPDISLRRKLFSARNMAQKTVIGQDRIVYSTDRDLVEQDYEAREWDRRFREIEK
ncbi:hypothetical protein CCACVL1_12020 [Corchorus capsularis]|uniref:Iron-sulfur cluster biosynthesis family protein n=1 Tax=Corchorus capsularis TaxID=210143 RepID=A0A1R3II35_COCAP|nr:hypothetical protein CCACVL1_12020 [Corchorus capsularis]